MGIFRNLEDVHLVRIRHSGFACAEMLLVLNPNVHRMNQSATAGTNKSFSALETRTEMSDVLHFSSQELDENGRLHALGGCQWH